MSRPHCFASVGVGLDENFSIGKQPSPIRVE
jgi:hypothetical protein